MGKAQVVIRGLRFAHAPEAPANIGNAGISLERHAAAGRQGTKTGREAPFFHTLDNIAELYPHTLLPGPGHHPDFVFSKN